MTDQERQLWLEERRKGIGGSDAPAICGLSPWKSPYQVYLDKRHEVAPGHPGEPAGGGDADTEPMFWGRTLEPVIRQHYANVTGKEVVVPNRILVHPKYEWMIANVDGLIIDDRLLEVKTSRTAIGWGDEGTDEIPDIYHLQTQHYLAVTGMEIADVAVLIGGSDFRIYHVPADIELQNIIIQKEMEFWKMVLAGTPPPVNTFADLQLKFGSASKGGVVNATPEVFQAWERLRELKQASKEEEEWKAIIMKALGENEVLMSGVDVLATWKMDKPSKRFNGSEFKKAHPETYEEFMRDAKPIRRLIIK